LHESEYFKEKHDNRILSNTNRYSHHLVRLPFYYELSTKDQDIVIDAVKSFGGHRQQLFKKDWHKTVVNPHVATA
jgi:dTDP-4-amino-4,6-dideoxygalactose transaminase